MNQVYPDEGLVPLLERLTADDLVFHLYTNDMTPVKASVLADFTEQAGDGYAEITVVAADWTLSGVAGHQGTLLAAPIAFTAAGGAWTIYGYYITNTAGTKVLWAARLDSAPVTVPDTESLLIVPVVGDFSQFP